MTVSRDDAIQPCVLTIAGSDSGGGAGIQADLKAFHSVGVHGTCVITALTAQNLRGVDAVQVATPEIITAQLYAVFAEFDIRAIKIGMLADTPTANTVATFLEGQADVPVVLDPVMVATSGARLLQPETLSVLRERLLPRATLITPNLPEAELLLGNSITTQDDMTRAARQLLDLGARAVLLKGGHLPGSDAITDIMATPSSVSVFTHERLPFEAHGTGCTLASAIAAYLALGNDLSQSVHSGIEFVHAALKDSYRISETPVRILRS